VRLAAEAVPPGGRCCENDLKGAVRLAVRDTCQAVWELAARAPARQFILLQP